MNAEGQPDYPYPLRLCAGPALHVLLGIPSTASRDAAPLLERVRPRPRVLNAERIPTRDPFVLVMNHYDHPRLGAWWGAMILACSVAERRAGAPEREIHFAMAREWWYPAGFDHWVKQPLTRWLFGQLAKTYGFIRLPPALDSGLFRGEGVAPIRNAISMTRRKNPQLIGISIEGQTGPNLSLRRPPRGAGLFILLLTHDTIPCLPVGLYEDEDCGLIASFGAPILLHIPHSLGREDRDKQAATQIMAEIGRQLPSRMWGAYQKQVAALAP